MWRISVLALGLAHADARLFAVPGHGLRPSPSQQPGRITDDPYTAHVAPTASTLPKPWMSVQQPQSRTYAFAAPPKDRASVRMNFDFQVDPLASVSSISIMALFGALLLNRSGLRSMKKGRDEAAENFRKAKIALLAGNLDLESYEASATAAEAAAQEYEAAQNFLPLDQDWTGPAVPRETNQSTKATGASRAPTRNEVPQMTQSVLDRQGDSRQHRADGGSDSESVSSPLGDVLFGLTLVPLLGMFAFSLTPDPVMEAQRSSAFDPNCEPCVQLHLQAKSDGNAQPTELFPPI